MWLFGIMGMRGPLNHCRSCEAARTIEGEMKPPITRGKHHKCRSNTAGYGRQMDFQRWQKAGHPALITGHGNQNGHDETVSN